MKTWQKWVTGAVVATAASAVGVLGGSAVVYQAITKSFSRGRRKSKLRAIAENAPADNAWYLRQHPAEWTQTSLDGLILRSSFLAADRPTTKVVILAHGLGHAREQMIPWARTFHDWGYDVLMPDARAHGESEGCTIGYGWPDRIDYQGWIQQVINKCGEDSQIVLLGISMGAATVMATAGEELPSNVKAVIADSGYASVMAEARFRLHHKYHVPATPTLPIADQYSRLAGYRLADGDIAAQLRKTRLPLLLIQGANDETVPVTNLNILYQAAAGPKQKYRDPVAGHIETRKLDPERYDRMVADFLKPYMAD
ncbi:alpha/beta hydrolase [Levilactobacillus andaensis]|uniref:alpha/beta hydrolase n=1 Tax=Levilactobacillus andaensis TaxID=2799570 RepID=UPI00194187D8|nr:alpha/beta hydrolase [Levilactobacillus andaensis]